MYIIIFESAPNKITVATTKDPLSFGMGIDKEIVEQVDKTGIYIIGRLTIIKEGNWDAKGEWE